MLPPLSPESVVAVSPLFQSSSLVVRMCFEPLPDEPMPHRGVIDKIEKNHNIMKDKWSPAKLVVTRHDQGAYS